MKTTNLATETKTARETLLANGFHRSPNTYFCCFDGQFYKQFERWGNQISEPLSECVKRYEGIEATEFGFSILFDHGKLCPFSLLHFPKWATEEDFTGAFERMGQFIKTHYKWEGGLAAGIWGN